MIDTNSVLSVTNHIPVTRTMHSHEYEWLSLIITFIGGGFGLKLLEAYLGKSDRRLHTLGNTETQLNSLLDAQRVLTQRNSELVQEYEQRLKEVRDEFERRLWQVSVDLTSQLDNEKQRCQAETNQLKQEIATLREALRLQLGKTNV